MTAFAYLNRVGVSWGTGEGLRYCHW